VIRLAVFVSGEGTNLEAIGRAIASGRLDARIAAVASDRPGCRALTRARRRGLATVAVAASAYAGRDAFERALVAALAPYGPFDLGVLAGYMRLAGPTLRAVAPVFINLHPSLLPAFPGLDAVGQALKAGVRVTGCTVHVVDAGMDTGPIVAQRAVVVRDGDDRASLGRRIQRVEHRLVPQVLSWWAAGWVHLEDGRVRVDAPALAAQRSRTG
jgi:phosphoribosylglycinamide formyltransferase-1